MKEFINKLGAVLSLILKPFFFTDAVMMIWYFPSRLVYKKLSNSLLMNRFTKNLIMYPSPITVFKIWCEISPLDDKALMRFLLKDFTNGMQSIKNNKNKVYKTEVNRLFLRLLEKEAEKLNINFEYDVVKSEKKKQIGARIMLISPVYFIKALYLKYIKKEEKSINLFKRICNEIEVYKIKIKFK